MQKLPAKILIYRGKECTCRYDGRTRPADHEPNCAWRLEAEYELEMDHDARKEMDGD